jgi:hypothetical protein
LAGWSVIIMSATTMLVLGVIVVGVSSRIVMSGGVWRQCCLANDTGL